MVNRDRLFSNRKGIVMDIFIVFVILLFCTIVIIMLMKFQESIDASLISPVGVLELGAEQSSFELEEYSALRNIYCNEIDLEKINRNFCRLFNSFSNLDYLKKNSQPINMTREFNKDNLCEELYEFSKDGDKLTVRRSGLVKRVNLKPEDEDSKINFDMDLEFYLEKEYLLTEEDCI